MAALNPAKFIREVRQEFDKVTWPSRKEATVSTLMVLVLVTLAAVFFICVDYVIAYIVRALIGI